MSGYTLETHCRVYDDAEGHYTLEIHCRVYDDAEGHYIKVGEDADGLDCVHIGTEGLSADYFGRIELTIPPELALMLAEALTRVARNIKERKK